MVNVQGITPLEVFIGSWFQGPFAKVKQKSPKELVAEYQSSHRRLADAALFH